MRIALGFSGGGLRGAAHVGVIKFLEEQGVEITAVSGSSAGAVVALMLANGISSDDMYAFLKDIEKQDLFKLSTNPGLFSLKNLEKKLYDFIGVKRYNEMKIPLYTCVTDINSGESLYLNSGDPVANTIASSSLTPTYEAKEIEGKLYVDGGFSDNLPVRPLKALGEKVLAINVNPLTGGNPKGFKSLLVRSILIMLHANVRHSKKITDAYIDIEGVARMHLFNFKEIDGAYEAGYNELKEQWNELKQKLV
ncbi:MAG: patatin-like phospholipase family protein [Campylobacterota bacterium]|nr:patatin-like phospholipase family protein [Campylobacterota bacterium]